MKNFDGFGLAKPLAQALTKMGYETPTPIQEKAIPVGLQGRDIMGSAQTGTGKTAAFAIPMVDMLLRNPLQNALILTPTRELAKQILTVIHDLTIYEKGLRTAFIIGGLAMSKQYTQLKARPRIIVGTPGRINDHLERGTIHLDKSSILVLDETDRMLDMGFGVQLDRIVKFLPRQRQTMMFSATLPKGIIALSEKYMNDPERISAGAVNTVANNLDHHVIRVQPGEKHGVLLEELARRQGSVIIFGKTKYGTERMAKNLVRDGFEAEALHGDLKQRQRDRVMRNFRDQQFRILVATDLASRGLDVPHVEHVINYDLPQVAEDYIHRIGRTARAGTKGYAVAFVSPEDNRKWYAIAKLMDPNDTTPLEGGGEKRGKGKSRGGNKSRSPGRSAPVRHKAKSQDNDFGNETPKKARPKNRFGKKMQQLTGEAAKPFSPGSKPRSDKPRSDKSRSEAKPFGKPSAKKPLKSYGKKAGMGQSTTSRPSKPGGLKKTARKSNAA